MEDPIFYQARPKNNPLSSRQKQLLLRQINRLSRESSRLRTHAQELCRRCHVWGIVAPDFSTYALEQWESLLCVLTSSFSSDNRF